jgi:hypothetical protein
MPGNLFFIFQPWLENKILPAMQPDRKKTVKPFFVLFYRALVEYFLSPHFLATPLPKLFFMKINSSILLTFALLLGQLALQAQPGGGWGGDPKQRADMQTQLMTDSLALSEAQSAKVGEINLKYAQKMQDAREGATAAGDWESMRATMQTMRAEQDKELQTVMTQDQWQSWTQIRETLRAQRGGPGGRQPGAPPAKEKPEGGDKTKGKSKSAGN